uniref:ribosome silencing factor n=1 Tax=uncultured Erythrobacter sp. TaxID=263913 RepID=UPI0026343BDE|nr:ribosome silencing factor [uncultured Erythrobacter sp.]
MTQAQSATANSGASTSKAVQSMAAANMAKHELHDLVMSQLDDDQAQEIVSIPLEGKSSVADFMVIASGRSTRQVAAIAQKLAEKVKHSGHGPVRIEGLPQADWVLVDAGDVVIHLFRPEVRTFYNLERMWSFEGGEPQQGRA